MQSQPRTRGKGADNAPEFVAADRAGSRVYRITFDNGAVFTTSLPAPWAIELSGGDEPPHAS